MLPPFHIYALTVNMLFAVRGGAESIMHTRFDIEAVLTDLTTQKISCFPGVPTMFTALINHPGDRVPVPAGPARGRRVAQREREEGLAQPPRPRPWPRRRRFARLVPADAARPEGVRAVAGVFHGDRCDLHAGVLDPDP